MIVGGVLSIRPWVFVGIAFLTFAPGATAQREPVLKQINEPHAYYFREMYLPQLTTGPSAVAWSPDSKSVVYSMAGAVGLQRVDSDEAEKVSPDSGSDCRPDW